MFKKIFLDGNIFIDANDKHRSSFAQSYKIIPFCLQNSIKIYTSCDLITTIYYILSKKDKAKALSGIEELSKFCKVIAFSNKEIEATCGLMREDKRFKDLEDTLQYVLALKEQCDVIISNDTNFFSKEIPLLSSGKFCEKYIDTIL